MTIWIVLTIILFVLLTYHRISLFFSTVVFFVFFAILSAFSIISPLMAPVLWVGFFVIAILLNLKPLRRSVITQPIFSHFSQLLPKLSSTEREALAAGTVGWESELFSGMPKWDKCLGFPAPKMSQEELAFLDGPVSELCSIIDNWDITHTRFNLPDNIWDFLKVNGFFGIIIPKKYGGKGFSAYAHSNILTKIAGKSMSVATVVAVPNSLGPAELLLNYGTSEQRDFYLPRLAKGIEIPCFALTGPEAGSDASAMPDYGIVCKGVFEGKEIIGIRLNWNKRYITLSPVATVLGLAFKLYDPEFLMGKKVALGITCALIPTHLPGITIGRRHYPLNSAFPNGPTLGKEVFIPIDWIIGGPEMAGQGWHMLMECLAAGRAISLPSMTTGGAKIACYTSGAYAGIRNQFHLPIGRFEGIEEALARIAGYTYIMDATRLFTVAAIDRGEKPAVPAAISKYHVTELGRKVINDAMDIHGGKAICMGPRNYLAITYQEIPISITVEGANILTRSMIIFGQGVIRCHPYILQEMQSAKCEDKKEGLKLFDRALFKHFGFFLSNGVRAFVLGITDAAVVNVPKVALRRYYQYLTRFSSALAFVSDVSILLLGSRLKQKEKLSGRLGDVLSMLYLGSAVLKQFVDHGEKDVEFDVVTWACQSILYNAQKELYSVLLNFPNRFFGCLLRWWIFPLGKRHAEPKDYLDQRIARLMISPNALRSILAADSYLNRDEKNPAGYVEMVLEKVVASAELEARLSRAVRDKEVQGYTHLQKIDDAIERGVLTQEEGTCLQEVYQLRLNILTVDDFSPEEIEKKQ